MKEEIIDSNSISFLLQDESMENGDGVFNEDSSMVSFLQLHGVEVFDLVIRSELWDKMNPILKKYNGRDYLVLQPGIWSDIIADEF